LDQVKEIFLAFFIDTILDETFMDNYNTVGQHSGTDVTYYRKTPINITVTHT